MIPKGFKFGAVEAAVKKPGRLDLGLIYAEEPASVAGVFTKSTVPAAPVLLCKERVKRGMARAIFANSGNANACTGPGGHADAEHLCQVMAEILGVHSSDVMMCSTGVIGQPLPVDRIERAMPGLMLSLGADPEPFAKAIMTTDLTMKLGTRTLMFGEDEITITAAAKGSGMIKPNMATMLCFAVTDAKIAPPLLSQLLQGAVHKTFNRITVDGDTSTNDTVLIMASGVVGEPLTAESPFLEPFAAALESLFRELARKIVSDGEGARKLVDVEVVGAKDEESAEKIAFTIAESPLVKTAIHGEDPNWGRIAAALGRSGAFAGGSFDIAIDGIEIVRNGLGLGEEAECAAHEKMQAQEFGIKVTIYEGQGTATVTTCDFSAEYVRINADYRS